MISSPLAVAPLAITPLAVLVLAAAAPAQTATTLGTRKDNTLYEDPNGTLSNAMGSRMFCGNTGFGFMRRAVIAFDVAAVVPPCSTIVSAELVLQLVMTRSAPAPVTVHRLLQDWGEGTSQAPSGQGGGGPATMGDATWLHTFFPNQTWNNAGGDFATAASGSTNVGVLGSYTWPSTPQMVADVQGWLDDPSQSFGWIVRTTETGTFTAKAFATKEDANTAFRPRLRITYTPPAASVTPFGQGCAGTGGSTLMLGSTGNPVVPNPGFALNLSGGPGGPHAFAFALSRATNPLPIGGGCFVHIDPLTVFGTATGDASRNLPIPVPNVPTLLGAHFTCQGVVVDTATSLPVTSNGVEVKLGV